MTKLDIAKYAVKFVVGTSTSYTVANVIKNNASPEKLHQKVGIAVASIAIGCVVAQKTENWAVTSIDDFVKAFKDAQAKAEIS